MFIIQNFYNFIYDVIFLHIDLQKTPYDSLCALRIFARCDDVMNMVMRELSSTIPIYTDLKLWSNPQWLENFEKNWPFR